MNFLDSHRISWTVTELPGQSHNFLDSHRTSWTVSELPGQWMTREWWPAVQCMSAVFLSTSKFPKTFSQCPHRISTSPLKFPKAFSQCPHRISTSTLKFPKTFSKGPHRILTSKFPTQTSFSRPVYCSVAAMLDPSEPGPTDVSSSINFVLSL